jgi:hypothetical protein
MESASMPDPTPAAQRQRLYRQRKAGLAPGGRRIPCESCPRRHTGKYGQQCSRCWERLTPEGRMAVAERVFLHRQTKAKRDNL